MRPSEDCEECIMTGRARDIRYVLYLLRECYWSERHDYEAEDGGAGDYVYGFSHAGSRGMREFNVEEIWGEEMGGARVNKGLEIRWKEGGFDDEDSYGRIVGVTSPMEDGMNLNNSLSFNDIVSSVYKNVPKK